MRRKDREVTDIAKIEQVIVDSHCLRIGFNDDGEVYIVPLNFGYIRENGRYTFYFHGAKEGRKIDLIAKNPRVGFEMDTGYALRTGGRAGECTASFRSIIGTGTMHFVDAPDEIRSGLIAIMHKNTGRADWQFNEEMLRAVRVFKLEADQLSCKEHE